ncbi:hypothetical protein RI367_003718 [Sorochytrium milnesiophthora]
MKRAIQTSPKDNFKKPRFNNNGQQQQHQQQHQQQPYDYQQAYYQPYAYYPGSVAGQQQHHHHQQQHAYPPYPLQQPAYMPSMPPSLAQVPYPHQYAQQYSPAAVPYSAGSPGYAMGSAAQYEGGEQPVNRTLYIGNLPVGVTAENVLDTVHVGMVEAIRMLPEKNCAFVSFVDPSAANSFYVSCQGINKLCVSGAEVRVNWAKSTPLPAHLLLAINQNKASRNVFIGNLHDGITDQELRVDVSQYGEVENIKIVAKRATTGDEDAQAAARGNPGQRMMAFVHFYNIQAAIRCVSGLPHNPKYAGNRISFGKDRCAPRAPRGGGYDQPYHYPRLPQAGQIFDQVPPLPPSGMPPPPPPPAAAVPGQMYGDPTATASDHAMPYTDPTLAMSGNLAHMPRELFETVNPSRNRTVYLGCLPEDCTPEDICNVVRAGMIERVHVVRDKKCAFVSFIDPVAAALLYHQVSQHGLLVRRRRVKHGWGKTTHPPPSHVVVALMGGASRNVYVGQVDPATSSVETLRDVFRKYGDIELVNAVPNLKCGFVSFTDIKFAIRAVQEAAQDPEIRAAGWEVSFGKDRCAGPVKPPREPGEPLGGHMPRRGTGTFGGHDEHEEFRIRREQRQQEQANAAAAAAAGAGATTVAGGEVASSYSLETPAADMLNGDQAMFDYAHGDGDYDDDDLLVQELQLEEDLGSLSVNKSSTPRPSNPPTLAQPASHLSSAAFTSTK